MACVLAVQPELRNLHNLLLAYKPFGNRLVSIFMTEG
jgi:hypothetical protein